jgi:hypothetical protein
VDACEGEPHSIEDARISKERLFYNYTKPVRALTLERNHLILPRSNPEFSSGLQAVCSNRIFARRDLIDYAKVSFKCPTTI